MVAMGFNGANLKSLESIKQRGLETCIFGCGQIGKGIAYDVLRMSGFEIAFYVDNHAVPGEIIRDSVIAMPLEYLYSKANKAYVFICVSEKYQEEILAQLISHGFDYDFVSFIDHRVVCSLAAELEFASDEIKRKYYTICDDRAYLEYMFWENTGKRLKLDNPQTFNEKLQWLKLYDRERDYTTLVDKYQAKRQVSSLIGMDHIVPTLGIWDRFDDIEFDRLPNEFVLKCTHDSGSVVICSDYNCFDVADARLRIERALERNYYWTCREKPYKDIQPRIIAEPLLKNVDESELKDYKVFAFNGEPQIVQVDYQRFTNHTRAMYSTHWEYLGFSTKYTLHKELEPKPAVLDDMLELTRVLTAGIPHVRADFYIVNQKIFFGELTFYHGGGYEKFTDEMWNYKMGKMITVC